MSVAIHDGAVPGTLLTISPNGSARVEARGADVGSNGSYLLSVPSGDLTAIAARSATTGHIFAMRWSQAAQICVLNKLRVRWYTNSGFTAAQLVGVSVFIARQFTLSYSANGTVISTSNNAMKKRQIYGSSNVADMRIATTAQLTTPATPPTLDPQPILIGYAREMAAAAAVPGQVIQLEWNHDVGQSMPIQLTQDTGIVVCNEIAMGAGGTARIVVDLDWSECTSY